MDIRSFFAKSKAINKITKPVSRQIQKLPPHTAPRNFSSANPQSPDPDLSKLNISEKVKSKISKNIKTFSKSKKLTFDWDAGEKVPYSALAEAFALVEKIPSRLTTISVMAEFFCRVLHKSPAEIIAVIYLTVNQVAPPYENIEIGIGDGILLKVVEAITGKKVARIKQELAKTGDLGEAVEKIKSQQMLLAEPTALTCEGVFKALKSLTRATGAKSRAIKIGIIKALLSAAKKEETRFLVRSLQGKLRIGFSESGVLGAVAFAISGEPSGDNEAERKIRKVFSEVPNWELMLRALLMHGPDELEKHCYLSPGIPIKVMLAKPTKSLSEVTDRFSNSEFAMEYKYDGERIQIHYSKPAGPSFFSRNAESITQKYPDIFSIFSESLSSIAPNAESFILDGEVVAFDSKNKTILPFQTLMTRKRKDVENIVIEVCVFCFDCLHYNGNSLLERPYRERRQILRDNFRPIPDKFSLVESMDTKFQAEIGPFLNKAVAGKCEGLMVKSLDVNATYEPSKRSLFWLKMKKDYLASSGDTFDLVPIGGYYGKGKRVGVFGAFLVACYDEESEEFQAICKVGTGMSEKQMKGFSDALKAPENVLDAPPRMYRLPEKEEGLPDVWFKATDVWEVRCADLSLSPKYFAAVGLVDEDKGVALRFPRFVRAREDKKPEDATSAKAVAEMYRMQFGEKDKSDAN